MGLCPDAWCSCSRSPAGPPWPTSTTPSRCWTRSRGALGVSLGTAGLLVTATQAGYVAGLLLIVPLGDLLQRRKLVSRLLVLDAVALAAAPRRAVVRRAGGRAGRGRRVERRGADPRARSRRSLAAEDERGRVVGRVMSGLLLGILLARTVAGLVAELGGWRLIYALAAGAMLILAVVLRRALPEVKPPERIAPTARCCARWARWCARSRCCGCGWRSASSRWRASAGSGRRSRSCSPGRRTATARR